MHSKIENFAVSMDSYSELLYRIEELIPEDEDDKTRLTESLQEQVSYLDKPEELTAFSNLLEAYGEAINEARTKAEQGEGGAVGFEVGTLLATSGLSKSEREKVAIAFKNILRHQRYYFRRPAHKQLLYRGLLTGIVAQFEVLVADLAHHLFSSYPGSLGTDEREKVLSVVELREFESIDEAIGYIVDDRVDSLIRDSLDEWKQFFSKRGVEMSRVCQGYAYLQEVIQRRHLIVHTGSKVSRQYLSSVDDSVLSSIWADDPQIGDKVTIDRDYITNAIRFIELFGILTGTEIWAKTDTENIDRIERFILDRLYENYVVLDQWEKACEVGRWGAENEYLSEAARMACRFNYWLSMKRLERWGEVSADIDALDTSALQPRFVLAQFALQEDLDQFFESLDRFEGTGLDREAWDNWPIFDEVRTDSRFLEARKKYMGDVDSERDIDEEDGNVEPR